MAVSMIDIIIHYILTITCSVACVYRKMIGDTADSRYSGSLKYGHLDIPAIWLGTER